MALGPIPSAAISAWVDREGYDETEAADFRRCIRVMDAALLNDEPEPISEEGMGALLTMLSK